MLSNSSGEAVPVVLSFLTTMEDALQANAAAFFSGTPAAVAQAKAERNVSPAPQISVSPVTFIAGTCSASTPSDDTTHPASPAVMTAGRCVLADNWRTSGSSSSGVVT